MLKSDEKKEGSDPGPGPESGESVDDVVRDEVDPAPVTNPGIESGVACKESNGAGDAKGDIKNEPRAILGGYHARARKDREDGDAANLGENDKETTPDAEGEPLLPISVAEDPLAKHPLQNTWTLWYLENDRSKSWEDMQNEISSFDTVEDFWSLYNYIKPPSEIKMGSDYSLFKKNIRPMWEDTANQHGGRWVITLHKSCKTDLDNLWLDVLLCLIGEAFDNSDQVCGAVVNIRGKNNKISIWTSNGNKEDAAMEIGQKLRDALCLERHNYLQYQLHTDTMIKQGSNVKSIYTL
ncbi:eukaryotic translation initiation factor 4E1-like [Drosophila tropicalis]|uniref:eukaryotic translation initiation factor 4E1-like n=1 Tax=Drosophila tropicalis TaxID=46794 RepID=UPI0035AB7839